MVKQLQCSSLFKESSEWQQLLEWEQKLILCEAKSLEDNPD
jgi:hypothetical protein